MDSFYYSINLRVLRKDPLAQPHVFSDETILYRPRDLTRVFPDPLFKAFALTHGEELPQSRWTDRMALKVRDMECRLRAALSPKPQTNQGDENA